MTREYSLIPALLHEFTWWHEGPIYRESWIQTTHLQNTVHNTLQRVDSSCVCCQRSKVSSALGSQDMRIVLTRLWKMAKGEMQLHQISTQFSYHLTHMQILITLRLVHMYGSIWRVLMCSSWSRDFWDGVLNFKVFDLQHNVCYFS